MSAKEVTVLLGRLLTRQRYLKFLDVSQDNGRCKQVLVLQRRAVVQHRYEILEATLYVLVRYQMVILANTAQMSRRQCEDGVQKRWTDCGALWYYTAKVLKRIGKIKTSSQVFDKVTQELRLFFVLKWPYRGVQIYPRK
jgi:hypothetical protein